MVVFSTENEAIASVRDSHSGKVVGRSLGYTTLHAKVNHSSLVNLPQEDNGLHQVIDVVVQFEDFLLQIGTTSLLQGQNTLVNIEGELRT